MFAAAVVVSVTSTGSNGAGGGLLLFSLSLDLCLLLPVRLSLLLFCLSLRCFFLSFLLEEVVCLSFDLDFLPSPSILSRLMVNLSLGTSLVSTLMGSTSLPFTLGSDGAPVCVAELLHWITLALLDSSGLLPLLLLPFPAIMREIIFCELKALLPETSTLSGPTGCGVWATCLLFLLLLLFFLAPCSDELGWTGALVLLLATSTSQNSDDELNNLIVLFTDLTRLSNSSRPAREPVGERGVSTVAAVVVVVLGAGGLVFTLVDLIEGVGRETVVIK